MLLKLHRLGCDYDFVNPVLGDDQHLTYIATSSFQIQAHEGNGHAMVFPFRACHFRQR